MVIGLKVFGFGSASSSASDSASTSNTYILLRNTAWSFNTYASAQHCFSKPSTDLSTSYSVYSNEPSFSYAAQGLACTTTFFRKTPLPHPRFPSPTLLTQTSRPSPTQHKQSFETSSSLGRLLSSSSAQQRYNATMPRCCAFLTPLLFKLWGNHKPSDLSSLPSSPKSPPRSLKKIRLLRKKLARKLARKAWRKAVKNILIRKREQRRRSNGFRASEFQPSDPESSNTSSWATANQPTQPESGNTVQHIGKEDLDPEVWGPIAHIPDSKILNLALYAPIPQSSEATWALVKKTESGSHNRVWIVEYSDGSKICVRVPAFGWEGKWTELDAEVMEVQVQTMRYIGNETGLKMPEVLAWDQTLDNDIGAPYILTSFLEGRMVGEAWADFEAHPDPEEMEAFRLRILKSVATNISALRSLKFNEMGMLNFPHGITSPPIIGPILAISSGCRREANFNSTLAQRSLPAQTHSIASLKKRLSNWQSWEIYHLQHNSLPFPNPYKTAGLAFLYWVLLLSIYPNCSTDTPESFVLAPPDFDAQNILVDDSGNVTGFIDWDSVATVPVWKGWASFPMWICDDWTATYDPDETGADSEEQLLGYRRAYAEYLKEPTGGEGCEVTAASHIFDWAADAIGDTERMVEIAEKILEKALPGTNVGGYLEWLGGLVDGEEKVAAENFLRVVLEVFVQSA
ncbi:hypothetical protein K402DRAFT_405095 [Aulographum hederae CBS 113979]|uniref:Aminoglycoside phosphotransferase domain-containing protein n=1 Tax=Aulographum hederae CBS 113979 TaxID=1176131 RepID=A0A6G1GXF0_9PEZI|nr:hypothetical protein K402DRAFT_405095 [Aulographum hederae CBS 113979]